MYLSSLIIQPGVDTSVLINIGLHKTSVAVDAANRKEHKSFTIPWGTVRIIDRIVFAGYSSRDTLQAIIECKAHGDRHSREMLNLEFTALFEQIGFYIKPFLATSEKTRFKIAGCKFDELKNCCRRSLSYQCNDMLVNQLPPL